MARKNKLIVWVFASFCLFYASTGNTATRYTREAILKAPIVYVHGVGVSFHPFEYLVPLKKTYKNLGHTLLVARTPAVETIDESADDLTREIRRLVPFGPFHLIGHSMGGLVARSMLARYDFGGRCLSLTTISTPHRGSKVADWILGEKNVPGLEKGVDIFALISEFFSDSWEVVEELSTRSMQQNFNRLNRNSEDVKYFSIASYIPVPALFYTQNPYLLVAHKINSRAGAELNDGPVAVESAKWGELLAVMPGDHYSNTAPIPFGGKVIYKDVAKIIVKNIEKNWN